VQTEDNTCAASDKETNVPDASVNVPLLGFGLSNYRSFDDDGFVLRDLKKVNVFIGKNNSGKSNVIRSIGLLSRLKKPGDRIGPLDEKVDVRGGAAAQPAAATVIPTDAVFSANEFRVHPEFRRLRAKLGGQMMVKWSPGTQAVLPPHPLDVFEIGELASMFGLLTARSFPSRQPRTREPYYKEGLDAYIVGRAFQALRNLRPFVAVPVFRELRKSDESPTPDSFEFNGHNVIQRLRDMQIPSLGRDAEREVFVRIRRLIRDLTGEQELVVEIPTTEERILVILHGRRLPLDSYGTGIHHLTLLCSALAMHENHVVAIEEPEIHLHPELQRKFLRFIAEETNNTYYITSHSNVFLDALEDVSVYHVQCDSVRSTVKSVTANPHARGILTDLGYKASDLLQSNGIIWVEGPSDRVYINTWIQLLDPDLVEGIHYSVAFYGGRVLAHFCCADDPVEDLVEVLKINRNALVMMDRDGDSATAKLNASKERILKELGPESCWVTQGREIENYLRPQLLERYLSEKYGKSIVVRVSRNGRLGKALASATAGEKPKVRYDDEKVDYARAFCKLMTEEDLDILDLREWLGRVIGHIRKWNHVEAAKGASAPE
jgi:hypothetical protein